MTSGASPADVAAPPVGRILLCDDSPVDCIIVRNLLEKRGYFVRVVEAGQDALAALEAERFDLLVIDYEMEGLSGVEVTRVTRQRIDPRLPIILLTARTAQRDRLEALEAGASDFVTKPFDPAELLARIQNHVYTRQLGDSIAEANRLLEEERSKVIRVQQSLLPREIPNLPGIQFAAFYLPSGMASGDYYDIIPRGCESVLLAIGDVSGHGIPSAMYMSILRATLRSKCRLGASIVDVIRGLNEVLGHALDNFSFVTFLLAEYTFESRELRVASAGHHPPLIQDLSTGSVTQPEISTTVPLGIMERPRITSTSLRLHPGCRVIFFTDGIVEMVDGSGADFGTEGLARVLADNSSATPKEACDAVAAAMARFRGGARQQDDATMLIMQIDA